MVHKEYTWNIKALPLVVFTLQVMANIKFLSTQPTTTQTQTRTVYGYDISSPDSGPLYPWLLFDCSKHKHWRWPSPPLCEIYKRSACMSATVYGRQFQMTERRETSASFYVIYTWIYTKNVGWTYGPISHIVFDWYMQQPGGVRKLVLFYVDFTAMNLMVIVEEALDSILM